MTKKIIVLGLITTLTLTLTACGGGAKEKSKDSETQIKVEETKKDKDLGHPAYSDFEIVISEEASGGYGKFDVTNNSEYSIEYIKVNYLNEDGKDILLHTGKSMLPADTIKGNQFMMEDGLDFKDFNPEWYEVKYLDENKESHVYRYDVKLDKYNQYN